MSGDINEASAESINATASFSSRDVSVGGRQARAKRRRDRQRRRLALSDSSSAGNNEATERAEQAAATTALPLHVRVIRLLGKLGGRCHDLVNIGGTTAIMVGQSTDDSSIASNLSQFVMWDPSNPRRLSIPISLGNKLKLDICFDEMLPRIVSLAETAQLRQAKTAACELLHAILLFMIAKNARRGGGSGRLKSSSTDFVAFSPSSPP